MTEVTYEVVNNSDYYYTYFYSDNYTDNYDPNDRYVFPNRTQYSKLGNFLANSANGRNRKTIFHDILNDLVHNLFKKSLSFREIRHQKNDSAKPFSREENPVILMLMKKYMSSKNLIVEKFAPTYSFYCAVVSKK